MDFMSLYLKKLENIASPPLSAIFASSIHKLLKKIRNQDEIIRDGEFHFRERATGLLGKWKESSEQKGQVTASSTIQPTSDRATKLNPHTQQPSNLPKAQPSIDSPSKTPVVDLIEKPQLEKAVGSELYRKLASDHSTELGAVPSKQQPPPSPTPATHCPTETLSQPLVIDLTENGQSHIVAVSELSCQPTSHHGTELGAVKDAQTSESSSPSSTSKYLFVIFIASSNISYRF
jgi:hypothetical protein